MIVVPGVVAAGGVGFDPIGISSHGWRAEDGITLDSSDNVSQWVDQVAGIVASQGNTGLRPDYESTAVNGLPGLLGDGTERLAASFNLNFGTSDFEMFAVVSALSGTDREFFVGNRTTDSGFTILMNHGAFQAVVQDTAGNRATVNGPSIDSGVHTVRLWWDSSTGTASLSVNGNAPDTDTNTAMVGATIDGARNLNLLSAGTGLDPMVGYLAEFWVRDNRQWSPEEREALSEWTQERYGVAT